MACAERENFFALGTSIAVSHVNAQSTSHTPAGWRKRKHIEVADQREYMQRQVAVSVAAISGRTVATVSYTHLTLPTICSV